MIRFEFSAVLLLSSFSCENNTLKIQGGIAVPSRNDSEFVGAQPSHAQSALSPFGLATIRLVTAFRALSSNSKSVVASSIFEPFIRAAAFRNQLSCAEIEDINIADFNRSSLSFDCEQQFTDVFPLFR